MVEAVPHTVLVIDDERGPRESLRILLKNHYRVLCADSVDWGLELMKQNEADAVVMDIRMPGKGGIEGLREIRHMDPHVAVIMLTGFGTLETAQEAIRLGADDYLKKPFDAKEMEEVINRNVQKTLLERRRIRAERELTEINQQLLEELAQKEHMAALGQKSAELVHDLRNPLTVIMGYVDLLSRELKESSAALGSRLQDTTEYIDMIEKSVDRCRELVEMWLSLGKRNPERMKPLSLPGVVRDVVAGARQIAEAKGVRIDYQPMSVECEIAGDQIQLYRAVYNVVSNAVEAAPEKTGVIKIFCGRMGEYAEIRVEDNGMGMDATQIRRAFEPYFTSKKVNGTGLGLFITKKVIEDHRGAIELWSQPLAGTQVTIRLPLIDRAKATAA